MAHTFDPGYIAQPFKDSAKTIPIRPSDRSMRFGWNGVPSSIVVGWTGARECW